MGYWRAALFVVAGAVFVLGFWVVTRAFRVTPCPGYSEPLDEPGLFARVWQLPVVAHPTVIDQRQSESWMISYPTSGHTVFELGAFLVVEDWTQSGNDAHPMGPRSVRVSLAPKEGTWSYQTVCDPVEYLPVGTELRYDDATRTHVLVVLNAYPSYRHPTSKGTLLPPPPGARGKVENRGFAFRVTDHIGGHRLREWKLLVAGGVGYLIAIVSLVNAFRRPRPVAGCLVCTLALLVATLCFLFSWP